jgi:hypothetical protein
MEAHFRFSETPMTRDLVSLNRSFALMIHFPGTPDSAGRFVVIEQLGGVMTITQAAELRVKWKQRVDPIPSEHLTLELELRGLARRAIIQL